MQSSQFVTQSIEEAKDICPKLSSDRIKIKSTKSYFTGNFIELVKQQRYSQKLQKKLKNASFQDICSIIERIEKELPLLVQHKYANYFVKTLISVSNKDQRLSILRSLRNVFYDACLSPYGIHPIQELLSLSIAEDEEALIRMLLKGKLVKL